ncbi:MAG: TerC/Alx family metal homeostasis membrane protein [Terriglobales bacterium]
MLVFWLVFILFVLAMLALDLRVLNRRPQRVSFPHALAWSAVWVCLAAMFAVLEFFWHGRTNALQFVTSYVIELAMSVDNLFLFLLIFRYFKVADEHQHKVLFLGILGALLMRGLFIVTGVGLIRRFSWITYAFGALLVYSGVNLSRQSQTEIHPERNPVLRLFRRIFPVTEEFAGAKFFVRQGGLYATPLLVVLLVVETTDILFAVDSIPVVLSITLNAFLLFTSNTFAILGLRSLYFALAGMIERFHYLHYGLAAVLILSGIKMLASHYIAVSTEWTLAVVLLVLGASVCASLLHPQSKTME